ncbi:S41 family peptidase [Tundrisphaera lichenicola]|uniref:S41 family peptidase n=1 Tax=Tundrisphaera lichenicola TaxID=2029860 RepID=UPI003EBC67D1
MPRRNLYAIVMVGALSMLCWQVSQGARPKDDVSEMYGVFVDAVEQVQQNYVRPVSRKELMESALKGMLSNLDPHSAYINTADWKSFKRQIEGKFGGVGMTVEVDGDTKRLQVIAPMVGTPAYAAGVLASDLILDIDGTSTEGLTIEKAVELLQGQPGTPVKLNVLHEGADKPEVLTLNRAIIEIPSVMGDRRKPNDEWDFMLDHDKKIGYIRITNFISDTAENVKDALESLKKDGMKALVLDLRDDPGGLLSAAVEISDLFVEEGKIVSTRGRNTTEKTFEAHKEGTYTGFPMVVLVNHNSASASEILSACLQDHDRALVLGERSYGKGSVQNILDLEDGNSVLKLTVATYWRPSGKNIHRFPNAKDTDEWGVSPSPGLEMKLSREDYHDWFLGRRDRDFLSSRNKPKPEEANKDEKDKKKPFVDKQLDKAVSVLVEKLEGK